MEYYKGPAFHVNDFRLQKYKFVKICSNGIAGQLHATVANGSGMASCHYNSMLPPPKVVPGAIAPDTLPQLCCRSVCGLDRILEKTITNAKQQNKQKCKHKIPVRDRAHAIVNRVELAKKKVHSKSKGEKLLNKE